ncbi:MAG: hypothetical protein ABI585_09410 [Betaproteobacteria bacterium]
MNTPLAPGALTAPTDTLARIAVFLGALACSAQIRWHRLDAWLDARRRVAQDRLDLAGMSERELRDIGVYRASVDAIAAGDWSRDPFR